jgi:hypothetical protein
MILDRRERPPSRVAVNSSRLAMVLPVERSIRSVSVE